MKYEYRSERTFKTKNKYLTRINRVLDNPECTNKYHAIEKEISRLFSLLQEPHSEFAYYDEKFIETFNGDKKKIQMFEAMSTMYKYKMSLCQKIFHDDGMDHDDAFDLIK